MTTAVQQLLSEARAALGQRERCLEVIAEIDARLGLDPDDADRGRLLVAKAAAGQGMWSMPEASVFLDEALDLLRDHGEDHEALGAITHRACIAMLMDDVDRCMDLSVEALHRMADADRQRIEYISALGNLSIIFREFGALEQAFDLCEAAFEQTAVMDERATLAISGFNLVEAALACRRGLPHAPAKVRQHWLATAAHAGDRIVADALDPFQRQTLGNVSLAEVELERDDLAAARAAIDIARPLVTPDAGLLYGAGLLTEGRILRREGDFESAIACFDTAIDFFEHDPNHVLALLRERSLACAAAGETQRALEDAHMAADQALLRQTRNIGSLMAQVLRRAELERGRLDLLRETDALTQQMRHDALTGLMSRSWLDMSLDRRSRTPGRVCILVLDLDYFKAINDGFSHMVGDEVLRRVGAVLIGESREDDLVARFGGEEFVVLPRSADLKSAMEQAERLRVAISRLDLSDVAPDLHVTVSVGVADGASRDINEVLRAADDQLYLAKGRGRNRVAGVRDTAGRADAVA